MTTASQTSDERALLAGIVATPEDDTARLVYADWLSENGEEDRGAFVRVQVEYARETADWKPENLNCLDMYLDPDDYESQLWKHRVIALRARADALLAAHPDWAPTCPRCEGKGEVGMYVCETCLVPVPGKRVRKGSGRAPCEFRRGFLHGVEVPRLTDVLLAADVPCPNAENARQCSETGAWECCRKCDYTGIIDEAGNPTDWALSLRAGWPTVRKVYAKDRVPFHNEYNVFWWLTDEEPENLAENPQNVIPQALCDEINRVHHFKGFATEAAANDALATALAQLVRGS